MKEIFATVMGLLRKTVKYCCQNLTQWLVIAPLPRGRDKKGDLSLSLGVTHRYNLSLLMMSTDRKQLSPKSSDEEECQLQMTIKERFQKRAHGGPAEGQTGRFKPDLSGKPHTEPEPLNSGTFSTKFKISWFYCC